MQDSYELFVADDKMLDDICERFGLEVVRCKDYGPHGTVVWFEGTSEAHESFTWALNDHQY